MVLMIDVRYIQSDRTVYHSTRTVIHLPHLIKYMIRYERTGLQKSHPFPNTGFESSTFRFAKRKARRHTLKHYGFSHEGLV